MVPDWVNPCYADARNPACGPSGAYEQKTCFPSCRHPNFGIESMTTVFTGTSYVLLPNKEGACPITRDMGGATVCTSYLTSCVSNAGSACAAKASADKANLNPSYGGDLVSSYVTAAASCKRGLETWSNAYKCTVTLQDPVYFLRSGPECGAGYSCDDLTRPIYNSCRNVANGFDPNPTACGLTSTPTRCSTADAVTDLSTKYTELKLSLDLAEQGKYTTLSATALADLKLKVVSKLKLLLELHGHQLDDTQRQTIRALYVNYPTLTPSCSSGTAWTAPTTDASCGSVSALNGLLTRCNRMAMAHVPPEASAFEMSQCVDAVNQVPSCAARPSYLSGYAGISTEILRNGLRRLDLTDTLQRRAELTSRMQLVSSWYSKMTGTVIEPADEQWRDVGVVAASLVQGAYSQKLDLLDAAPDLTGVNLLLQAGPAIDQELIQAAFPAAPATAPLTGAPLLFVLADALKGTSDRLDETDFLHDLGCRFQDCRARSTPVSQMHQLLADFPDAARLASTLTAVPNAPAGWYAAFAAISNRHDILESAVAPGGGYTPGQLSNAPRSQQPLYALGSIAKNAQTKMGWYSRSGRFRSVDTNAVVTSLLQSKLTDALGAARGARAALSAARSDYLTNVRTLIDGQIDLARTSNAVNDARTALDRKAQEIGNLVEDLEAHRTALDVDGALVGSFGEQYQAAVSRLTNANPSTWIETTTSVLTVRPTHAVYPGGRVDSFDGLAVPGSLVHLAAGDLLHIGVGAATYEATCALTAASAAASVPDPLVDESQPFGATYSQYAANPSIAAPAGARAGPQGYALTYQSSHFTADGMTDRSFTSGSQFVGSAGSAAGSILTAAGVISGPAGAAVAIGSSIISSLFGGDSSSSSSSGDEYRTTATYNVGMRVPTAPFREQPVGALLAVRTQPGNPTVAGLIDITVVQSPASTLVIDQPSDVYLVVNDRSCSATRGGQLDVSLKRLRSLAGFAAEVQPALGRAIGLIDTQARLKFTNQGSLLTSDLNALRTQALAELTTNCANCSQPGFAPLMQFFGSMVETDLNLVERRIEIHRLERQLRLMVADWTTLATQVAQAQRVSQLVSLRQVWAARNIDDTRLKDSAENLARSVDRHLYPFLRAKYPETLAGWGTYPALTNATVFTDLTSYDWSMDWAALADKALTAFDRIDTQLTNADVEFKQQILNTGSNLPVITIAIPRPRAGLDPTYGPGDGDLYATNFGTPALSYTAPFRELPSSADVWAKIEANEPASFTIPAELLYNSDDPLAYKYPGQLACIDTLPVITSVGLTVLNGSSTDATSWDAQYRPVTLRSDRQQRFVGAAGPVQLLSTNPAWLWFTVPLQYTTNRDALIKVGGGEGLSPASRFTILPNRQWLDPEMGSNPGVRRTVALLLRLQVERRQAGVRPTWLKSVCP
jgi:hypothetical protein